ncbi:MAG: hypothetical protein LBE85_10820 [Candidatus Accumulibacter sp.]|jgi:septal ring factor EnvC (AmiA/AmiB activator)|nr:hypothetical protein [Accumulibacter sp.]
MASDLGLTIAVSATAGSAMAVFGSLKGVMQRVADVTKNLKAQQSALGKEIEKAAKLPQADLARLHAQYAKQEKQLTRLRASTKALGRSQAAIAANEARRASLRGKMVETGAIAYAAAVPIRCGFRPKAKISRHQNLCKLVPNNARSYNT